MHFADLPISPSYPHRSLLTTAIELAQRGGDLLLDIHRHGPQRIEHKSSHIDLVTEADLACQAMILEGIDAQFPDHGILAEESGSDRTRTNQPLWIIDPLDGTTNFAHRFPIFAVSIGVWVDDQPEIGVIQDVVRQRTYWGARGQGAWVDLDRRLRVSDASELSDSLLASGFPYNRVGIVDNNLAEFDYLTMRSRGVRRVGSAALDMAWLADGRLDGYWETGLAAWDWAAGILLVTEAGGRVTDYVGGPCPLGQQRLVFSNGALHPALLGAIATARRQAGLSEQ